MTGDSEVTTPILLWSVSLSLHTVQGSFPPEHTQHPNHSPPGVALKAMTVYGQQHLQFNHHPYCCQMLGLTMSFAYTVVLSGFCFKQNRSKLNGGGWLVS